MAEEPDATHHCGWRERAQGLERENAALRERADRLERENVALQERVARLEAQLAQLQRALFGRRSEKMAGIQEELRRASGDGGPSRAATLTLREERREARASLPERIVHHRVAEAERRCPACGSTELKRLGPGKRTVLLEYVPARIERQVHVQETLACRCGEGIVTAAAPVRPIEQGHYGPALLAHLVTAKVCDSIPLYRQAKALARAGAPIARTTLCDLFHEVARALSPLSARVLARVREAPLVRADETPQRVLDEGKTRRAYVWTFRTENLIAYVHSASRSGATPESVLGGTRGYLLVDGYTGYNRVTLPEGRTRVACWAHVRRKFFDARSTAPEATRALELILDLYRVEYEAAERGLLGTPEHLALRREKSAPVLQSIATWLAEGLPLHPPRGPMGLALRYAQGQWAALTRFLEDASLPLDNNASERALRAMALGRKNYLFVGTDEAGQNLAGLASLVATCEANGVNPEAYLADVLLRLGSHPASALDELLPHRWSPAPADSS